MRWINLFYLLIILIFVPASFANINVEKFYEGNLEVGEKLTIGLRIENTYDQDVAVTIVDSNIIADNGIKIKCMEKNVGAGQVVIVNYDSISLYKSGEYDVDGASIRYDVDGVKEVGSNGLNLIITGDDNQNAKGVTEIYQCNGIVSRSTSLSTGGSNINMNLGGNLAGNTVEPKQVFDDTAEFKTLINNDLNFTFLENELIEDGYILQDRRFNVTNESYALFAYQYKDNDKERFIYGVVDNGIVYSNVSKKSRLVLKIFLFVLVVINSFIIYFFVRAIKLGKKKPKVKESKKVENVKDDHVKMHLKKGYSALALKNYDVACSSFLESIRSYYKKKVNHRKDQRIMDCLKGEDLKIFKTALKINEKKFMGGLNKKDAETMLELVNKLK